MVSVVAVADSLYLGSLYINGDQLTAMPHEWVSTVDDSGGMVLFYMKW